MNGWVLVDTDILIDISRGDHTAIKFLEDLESHMDVAISVITQMELIVGSENKRELRIIEEFVSRFEILPLTELASEKAVALLRKYRLSHGLLIADAFIAATAIVNKMPLASKNQRDYRFISDLALLPYPPKQI